MNKRVLVIEDEERLRRVVQVHLSAAGFEVETAGSAEAAVPRLDWAGIVLTDLRLPGEDGLALVARIQSMRPGMPVVVMTAFGSVETAVAAMKAGAADFVQKPFSLDHLQTVIEKAFEVKALREENQRLREELGGRYQIDN
ncbi:MAG: two-component system response regulator, partial [Acidobacteriia bacterium 12-62-4]